MFSRIHHTGYWVRDLDASIAWYEQTFGAKVVGRGEVPTATLAFLHMGDAEVELVQPTDQSVLEGRDHVFNHVGYVVDDLDAAVTDFKAKGYKFFTSEPIVNPVGHRLIMLDPSFTHGMRIHLTDASELGG